MQEGRDAGLWDCAGLIVQPGRSDAEFIANHGISWPLPETGVRSQEALDLLSRR